MSDSSPSLRGKSRPNRTARQGSFMSTKQIKAQAAMGRPVSLVELDGSVNTTGYVVGMDDYHLMLVVTGGQFFKRLNGHDQGTRPAVYETVLIHKGSVPAILLHTDKTLDQESESVRDAVLRVGRSFISFCNTEGASTS